MRNRFLMALFLATAMISIFTGCDKRSGGRGCDVSRTVYSKEMAIVLSFISKDSINLLTTKEVQPKDIAVKYGSVDVDTLLVYDANNPQTLKYLSVLNFSKTGENTLTIFVKGIPHTLSFNNKWGPGGCAGPKQYLSDFKVDGKVVKSVLTSEQVYTRGTKMNMNFIKLYFIL